MEHTDLLLAKAIAYQENGGKPDPANTKAGPTGEAKSLLQFMPATWKGWSKEVTGKDDLELTPENEMVVATGKIKKWREQGLNGYQIASMWNSGEPNAYTGKFEKGSRAGYPSVGVKTTATGSKVKFDVPGYAEGVKRYYDQLLKEHTEGALNYGAQGTGSTTPNPAPLAPGTPEKAPISPAGAVLGGVALSAGAGLLPALLSAKAGAVRAQGAEPLLGTIARGASNLLGDTPVGKAVSAVGNFLTATSPEKDPKFVNRMAQYFLDNGYLGPTGYTGKDPEEGVSDSYDRLRKATEGTLGGQSLFNIRGESARALKDNMAKKPGFRQALSALHDAVDQYVKQYGRHSSLPNGMTRLENDTIRADDMTDILRSTESIKDQNVRSAIQGVLEKHISKSLGDDSYVNDLQSARQAKSFIPVLKKMPVENLLDLSALDGNDTRGRIEKEKPLMASIIRNKKIQ